MCNKILWLHRGEQIAFGNDVEKICAQYSCFLENNRALTTREQRNLIAQIREND